MLTAGMTLRKLGVRPRYRPCTPSWDMMYLNWPAIVNLGLPSVVAARREATEVTVVLRRNQSIAVHAQYVCNKSEQATLRLHACADESERIGCQLTTSAGDGATAHQDQNSWICCIYTVPLEPGVLQSLPAWAVRVWKNKGEEWWGYKRSSVPHVSQCCTSLVFSLSGLTKDSLSVTLERK